MTPEDQEQLVDELALDGWVLAHQSADLWRFEKAGVGAGVVNAVGPTLERAAIAARAQGVKVAPGAQTQDGRAGNLDHHHHSEPRKGNDQ